MPFNVFMSFIGDFIIPQSYHPPHHLPSSSSSLTPPLIHWPVIQPLTLLYLTLTPPLVPWPVTQPLTHLYLTLTPPLANDTTLYPPLPYPHPSSSTLASDTTPYPMLVLVGPDGMWKHVLILKLVEEFPDYFGIGLMGLRIGLIGL